MNLSSPTHFLMRHSLWGLYVAVVLTACVSTPPASPPAPVKTTAPAAVLQPPPPPVVIAPTKPEPTPPNVSKARTEREFRQDAARHIYEQNAHRIYSGRLPPLLKAVGVMDVVVDRRGNVLRVEWRRAPKHAPDVIKEIERTVMAAAPYPAPVHLGQATYTDTWLWDKSGRFQLDTLTEGQR